MQNRVSKLEKQIETLDKSQKSIDTDLSDPEKFKKLSQKEGFFEEYEKNQQKLQELEAEWEQVAEKLEAEEAQIAKELTEVQGKAVNIAGYFHPTESLVSDAMRPSATLNAIIG